MTTNLEFSSLFEQVHYNIAAQRIDLNHRRNSCCHHLHSSDLYGLISFIPFNCLPVKHCPIIYINKDVYPQPSPHHSTQGVPCTSCGNDCLPLQIREQLS